MVLKPEHIIFILVSVSLGCSYIQFKTAWPVLSIANRWLRWFTFSIMFAWLGQMFGMPDPKPYGLLFIIGFLIYLLFETIYSWVAISILSKSELDLFPKFRSNQDGDEWPSHRRYFKAKEWVRENGFTRVQSIKAMLDERLHIRATVYENSDKTIRLQILFIPQRGENLAMCYVFSSKGKEETRFITDNMFLPFGGFYPERWHLVRKPMVRAIGSLFVKHKKRLKAITSQIVPWCDEPLEDLNMQQKQLEQTNTRAGFLVPRHQQEEYGKITGEGRYRIWKEIWLLNYFGIPSSGSFRDEKA